MLAKPCAVFLWTHKGLGRERITSDTPLEVALAESKTMRVQYEAAQRYALSNGLKIDKPFMFEETGHLPTDRAFPTMRRAISWCKANSATLIIHALRSYPGRGFTSINMGIFMKHFERNNPDVRIVWINPSPEEEGLREHFDECRRAEKLRRKNRRISIKLRRLVADDKFIPYLALGGHDQSEARERGRATQSESARLKALHILQELSLILRSPSLADYSDIAVSLNIIMQSDERVSPPRAKRWTEAGLRRYLKYHKNLWGLVGFSPPQSPFK